MTYVYFLQSQGPKGLIKIGFSTNPWSRLAHFRSASPVPLELIHVMPATEKVEAKLHKKFASDRQHGKWFTPSEALLAFLRESKLAHWVGKREPLLTLRQAAEALGETESYIDSLCKKGALTPVFTQGGHRRFVASQLQPFSGINFGPTDLSSTSE